MNNSKLVKIGVAIVFTIIGVILYVNVFGPLDSDLLNKNWYRYDPKTGNYEVLNLSESKLLYYYPENKTMSSEYNKCTTYRYNKVRRFLVLNCFKRMKILYSDTQTLVINFDDEDRQFFLDIDLSFNREFYNYFRQTLSEYKLSNSYISQLNKTDFEKAKESLNEGNKTYVLMQGDNCNNIECTLFLKVFEKWIVSEENVYYIDSSNINEIDMEYLNGVDSKLKKYKDFYDNSYPRVMIFDKNKLIKTSLIKCNGLDCSKYEDYIK